MVGLSAQRQSNGPGLQRSHGYDSHDHLIKLRTIGPHVWWADGQNPYPNRPTVAAVTGHNPRPRPAHPVLPKRKTRRSVLAKKTARAAKHSRSRKARGV